VSVQRNADEDDIVHVEDGSLLNTPVTALERDRRLCLNSGQKSAKENSKNQTNRSKKLAVSSKSPAS
jgi:hypothetical protein